MPFIVENEMLTMVFCTTDSCANLKQRLGDYIAACSVSDPFWTPVLRAIIERLRDTPCIKTESGEYVLPECAVIRGGVSSPCSKHGLSSHMMARITSVVFDVFSGGGV